jgi:hypothetical protein
MSRGCRKPGSDPRGSSRSAHQTSRRWTTTQPADTPGLCAPQGGINATRLLAEDLVEASCTILAAVLCHVLRNRRGVELASGQAESVGKSVRRLEEVTGEGDRCFHTGGIPKYDQRASALTPVSPYPQPAARPRKHRLESESPDLAASRRRGKTWAPCRVRLGYTDGSKHGLGERRSDGVDCAALSTSLSC